MPLGIPTSETLAEFEIAREDRYQDGIVLETKGRRMGAAYLLGYTVELTLKCAFFRIWDYTERQPIRVTSVDNPSSYASGEFGFPRLHEPLHNPEFWARLIVRVRAELDRPLDTSLSIGLVTKAVDVAGNWRVAMRYWRTRIGAGDFRSFLRDVMWFRTRYQDLWR